MRRQADAVPYQRVGMCCGERCRRSKRRSGAMQALYRVREDLYRYRCAVCFRLETGHNP